KAQPTPRVAQEEPKSAAVTNFDILKRLSNIEREVFGKKLDETPSTPVTPSAPSMPAEPANHDVDNAQTRQISQDNLSQVFTRNKKHLLE
ncbi:hypothetical protein ACSFCN_14065, partial [Enterococcus faecalis]